MRNIFEFNCQSCGILAHSRNKKPSFSKFCTSCQNDHLWEEYKFHEKQNVSTVIPDKFLQSEVLMEEIRRHRKQHKKDKLILSQFNQFYKGDINYYPGTRLDYKFLFETPSSSIRLLESHLKQRIANIEKNLIQEFGSLNTVQFKVLSGKRRYLFKCPECVEETFDLKRHLKTKKHDWSNEEATFEHSYRVRIFNFLTKIAQEKFKRPRFCPCCYKFQDRLDLHICKRK